MEWGLVTIRETPGSGPRPDDLRGLLYRSSALQSRRAFESTNPLEEFAARNAKLGLTGYLHVEDDSFYQFLEGRTDDLEIVWEAIQRDPRHTAVTLLFDGPVPARRFGNWAMGYSTDEAQSLFQWTARSDRSLRSPHPERIIIAFLEHVAGVAAQVP